MMLTDVHKVLFIGAHSDDEMLSAGTLHRLSRGGCEVHVLTFAAAGVEGDRAGHENNEDIIIPEWDKAMNVIRARSRCFEGMRPSCSMLNRSQEIRQAIFARWDDVKPDVAIVLSKHDDHAEHVAVGACSEEVLRGRVRIILRQHFPWSYQAGRCNLHVELSEADMTAKRAVINAYQSQRFRYDYEALLMGQAVVDGLSVKVAAAEKFEIIRCVI